MCVNVSELLPFTLYMSCIVYFLCCTGCCSHKRERGRNRSHLQVILILQFPALGLIDIAGHLLSFIIVSLSDTKLSEMTVVLFNKTNF